MVIYAGANHALVIHVRYTWFTMEALEDTWENLQKIIEVCKLTSSDLFILGNNFCSYSFLVLTIEGKIDWLCSLMTKVYFYHLGSAGLNCLSRMQL